MLLDPTVDNFLPKALSHNMQLDSEQLSDQLQSDLAPLKALVPELALLSDNDRIPGIHCPLTKQGAPRRDMDSYLPLAIRGKPSYHICLKEKREMHLIRLRVHYYRCNEKSMLQMIKQRFEAHSGMSGTDISVTQRKLLVKMNNTWLNIG